MSCLTLANSTLCGEIQNNWEAESRTESLLSLLYSHGSYPGSMVRNSGPALTSVGKEGMPESEGSEVGVLEGRKKHE